MQKHAFERWIIAVTVLLGGMIVLAPSSHALSPVSVTFAADHPVKTGIALIVTYLGVKMFPGSREHF